MPFMATHGVAASKDGVFETYQNEVRRMMWLFRIPAKIRDLREKYRRGTVGMSHVLSTSTQSSSLKNAT
jgi:hypothetical protein